MVSSRCLGPEHQTCDITNTEDMTLTLMARPLPRAASERFRGKSDENEGSGHTLENQASPAPSEELLPPPQRALCSVPTGKPPSPPLLIRMRASPPLHMTTWPLNQDYLPHISMI